MLRFALLNIELHGGTKSVSKFIHPIISCSFYLAGQLGIKYVSQKTLIKVIELQIL